MRSGHLSTSELAWLRLDRSTNPSISTVVLNLDRTVDASCLRSRIEDRLLPHARLRQTIEKPHLPLARPHWRDHDEFRLSNHLKLEDASDQDRPITLPELLSHLQARQLDDSLPLWRIHLAPLAGGRCAVVARLHQSLCDGTAAPHLVLQLADTESAGSVSASPAALQSARIGLEPLVSPSELHDRALDTPARTRMLCRLISTRADHDSPLRSEPSQVNAFGWTKSGPIDSIEDRAARLGTTAREAILSAVTRALRSALHRLDTPTEDLELRAVLPLNLRRVGDPPIGTRMSLGLMGLPVSAASPPDRLQGVREELARFQKAAGQMAVLGAEPARGLTMTEIDEQTIHLLGRKASLMLGFLDGPSSAIQLCGRRVSELMWWPALSGDLCLGVSVVSYAGRLHFGVTCDATLACQPEKMAADIAAALEDF